MATDDILGTGYQPPAKPFNVISPGGVSGAQSLGMLTSMKNQASENATRMNIAQQQMQHEQQMQEEQIAFEAQEAEKQRKMMEERYRDENFFRERSEELSALYQDHEGELSRLDDERTQAILAGNWAAEGELAEKKRILGERKREIAKRLNGLGLLKKGRDGLFSKDFQNEKGSLGAQFIDAITQTAAAKQGQFSRIMEDLLPVMERLKVAKPESPTEDSLSAKIATRARKVADEKPKPGEPGAAGVQRKIAGFIADTAEGFHDVTSDKSLVQKEQEALNYGSRTNDAAWEELSAVIASAIIGKSGESGATSTDLALSMKTMLTNLDQAAKTGGDQQAAAIKKAKEQYLSLEKSGADVRMLDRILYSMYRTTRTGQSAQGAIGQQAVVQGQAAGENIAPSTSGDPSGWGHLNKMLSILSTVQDERQATAAPGERPMSTKLLKAWDSDDMDLYLGGDKTGHSMEKMILDTVGVLAGAADPADLMRKLVNDDPNDDPANLKFIQELHPEVRKALTYQLQKGLMQLEDLDTKVKNEYGVDAGGDLIGKMRAAEEERDANVRDDEEATLEMGRKKSKSAVDEDTKARKRKDEERARFREERQQIRSRKSPSQEAREKLEGKEKDPLRK